MEEGVGGSWRSGSRSRSWRSGRRELEELEEGGKRDKGDGLCSDHCVLSVKVARSLVSRSVWRVEWDFDRLNTVS